MHIAEHPEHTEHDTAVAMPLPSRLLAAIAVDRASFADFGAQAAPRAGERTAARLYMSGTHDVWLIRWGSRSGTEIHDHGASAGALYVAAGTLVEHRPDPECNGRLQRRRIVTSEHRIMPATHIHAVVNESDLPAESVHVYSPPLTTMQHYERTGRDGLRATQREVIDLDTFESHYGAND